MDDCEKVTTTPEAEVADGLAMLRSLVESIGEDAAKAVSKGNKAAATRARSALQDVKKVAHRMRAGLLELRKGE